ncbi:MAG: hypothetical protein K8F91_02020 [Candidatus Obscuribacterales bacterium]|nr:hypothetical protein [Candidatus Obscuribacterales bacterium]
MKEGNLGFRQFSYRGLENAQQEWSIVCIATLCLRSSGTGKRAKQ